MKQRGVFLIGLIIIVFYFFIFPRQSGHELVLAPAGLISLGADLSPSEAAAGSLMAIRSGNLAGFIDQDQQLISLYSSDRMAVDDEWIAISGMNSVEILDPDGRLRSRISDKAIPISRNGHLYLYDGEAGRLVRVDPSNGRIYWSKDYLSAVTVLDGRGDRTLVGLLDGRVQVISRDGDVELEYRPGGSRIEALYGGALSESGNMIAIIAGLDPQRFVLLEERKNGFRPIAHHDTDTDFRRSVPVKFVRGGAQVLYEGMDSIMSYSVGDGLISAIDLPGSPVAWEDSPLTGALIVAGRDSDHVGIRMLSRYELVLYKAELPFSTTDLRVNGDQLLVIDDRHIGILEMTEQ